MYKAKVKIREGLKVVSKGYLPIRLEKLKEENKALYDTVEVKNDGGRMY